MVGPLRDLEGHNRLITLPTQPDLILTILQGHSIRTYNLPHNFVPYFHVCLVHLAQNLQPHRILIIQKTKVRGLLHCEILQRLPEFQVCLLGQVREVCVLYGCVGMCVTVY